MPELSHSVGILPGEAVSAGEPEMEHALHPEAASIIGGQFLRGFAEAEGAVVLQPEVNNAVPEMPSWHADIDPTTLTVEGLIKACSHFAAIAAANPALAERVAERTIEFKRIEVEMRQQGADQEAARKQQWSSMLKRHREKTRDEEAPKASKAIDKSAAEQSSQPVLEPATIVPLKDVGQAVAQPILVLHESHTIREESAAEEAVAQETVIPVAMSVLPPANSFTFIPEAVAIRAAHDHRLFNEPNETEFAPVRLTTNDQSPSHPELVVEQAEAIEHATTNDELRNNLPAFEQSYLDSSDNPAEESSDEALPVFAPAAPPTAESTQHDTLGLQSWSEIVEQEPLAVYDYFADALSTAAITNPQELATPDEGAFTAEPATILETAEELQTPAIVATINEYLADLEADQKAEYAPLLGHIIEEVQNTNVLIAEGTEPEAVEAATAQLEALTTQLLERLGVVHEQEDVACFVSVLLRLDLQTAHSETPVAADLENDGTHEAKLHFAQFMGGLSGVEETIERLLGKLVMFHATPLEPVDSLSVAA